MRRVYVPEAMTLTSPADLGARAPHVAGAPRGLARFAWGVLVYNLAVVAWGAFVRASGSGAGCGRHWPLCNGEVVPRPKSIETIIEATHRATSGLAFIAVAVLLVWVFRALPRRHHARKGATYAMIFMVGEAALGAGLVLFELVGMDASLKRAFSMILHLGNTFLLIGSIALTAYWLSSPRAAHPAPSRASSRSASGAEFLEKIGLFASLGGVLVLGGSGAIAALGDTLFPAASLREGLAQDLSPVAHVFLRLRLLHPFLALGTGSLVLATAALVRARTRSAVVRRWSYAVTALFVVQFSAGLLNLVLLAPVFMQLVHLLLADATWIALVLLAWETLYGRGVEAREGDDASVSPVVSASDASLDASFPVPTASAFATSASPARSDSRKG